MKLKWLRYFLFLCAGLVLPANAQLQFTNVSADLSNLNLTNLLGITCGGASNSVFVAVGANSSVVTWTLTNLASGANQNTNWGSVSNGLPRGNFLLDAAVFGGSQFLVSGSNNVVFSSVDAVNWTSNGMVFANSATARGLAFNNGIFVAVASAAEIAWTNNVTGMNHWVPASIPGVSYADSFRGVTAFNLSSSNSTNFASCGILGRLATSSDGGRDWATPYGAIGQPGLFGITSDNRQTLVCVGANGAILTFTNGGTLWSSNSWGTSTLNAASYIGTNYLGTNYGFITVGAAGSVWMSAEGTNWANIKTNDSTLKANSNNLNGVFFATSGQFKGVGVLVGDHGTIILAGTPPPPPTNSVGATNCATSPNPANNNPLSVTEVPDANYPLGTVTVDWYDAPTGGDLISYNTSVVDNTYSFVPTNNAAAGPNNPGFYTYYAEARDLRTGFINTNRTPVTLQINPRPTATLVTTNTICNGDSTVLQVNLTGLGTWTVTWTNGFTSFTTNINYNGAGPYTNYLTIPNGVFNPINVFPNAPTNHYYWVTSVTNSDSCMGNQPGDITGTNLVIVNPRPTATLVTTNTICNGSSTPLQANLTGIGPWTVYWTDGFTNYIQVVSVNAAGPYTDYLSIPNSAFNPTNVFPNLQTNHYYWVTSVADTNCDTWAIDISGTNLVKVNPRPTATLVTTNTICNGSSTPLQANLTGIGPWTVYWTDGFTNYIQVVSVNAAGPYTDYLSIPNSAFNPTNVFPNLQTNHYYWVTSVADTNCDTWAIDISGTNLVKVNPRPTATLVTTNTICNGDTTVLQANLTGLGSWTVTWTNGFTSFTTNINYNGAGPYIHYLKIPNVAFNLTNTLPNTAVTNYYWVTSVTNSDSCMGNQPGDITGTNLVIVDPVTAPPTNNGNMTSCYNVAVPLSVSVPPGFTVDWYSNATRVASGTNVYVPPVPINLGTNSSLTNTYDVFARFIDPNLTNCYSLGTNVSLISLFCTNMITSITPSGTNVLISWSGNYVLQSTTNLTPPVTWTTNVFTGATGPNTWTNSTVPPPTDNFFRLYAPTN